MNRREFLQVAALVAGGAALAPHGRALNHEQHAFLAAAPDFVDRPFTAVFSEPERRAVAAMADQVIPATDTPGALDAGVPRFIEAMVGDWFDEAERASFMDGLAATQRRAGGDFAALDPAAQLRLLEALEDEAGDAPWYTIGATIERLWDGTAPFVCQLKELCVLGFMLSATGATQFLRENPMGHFDGDVALGPDDPAWATQIPLQILAKL